MRVLFVSDANTINLHDALLVVEAHGLTPDQITLATNSGTLEAASMGFGYDMVLSVASTPGHHSVQRLGALAAALKPGGRLVVKKEVQQASQQEEQLRKNLLLAGFVDASAQPDGQGLALHARKPEWETGAKAAISLKPRSAAASAQNGGAVPAAPSNGGGAKAAWLVSPDDEDGEDEVLDEEELLTEEDKLRPAPAANGGDDCEVGAAGRKACKNCTCGRAEAGPDAKPAKLTKEMLENPTSGCGSCALGDAFRCGGCPYRGLPAFEMGKPIQLSSDFLAVDL